jgi:hypothetical protein
MYYHFGPSIQARLDPANLDPLDDQAFPLITNYFLDYVDQWVNGKGAFGEYGENVTISRRFEDQELRRKIAERAARDFIYSYKLVRGTVIDAGTVEHSVEARIEQFRAQQVAQDVNAAVFAWDEAWKPKPAIGLAYAVYEEMEKRKEDARVRAPRFHARPRLVSDAGKKESIEFVISVLDGPETGKVAPANSSYKTFVRYALEPTGKDVLELTAYIQVIGAQTGEKIMPYVPAGNANMSAAPNKELAIKFGRISKCEPILLLGACSEAPLGRE